MRIIEGSYSDILESLGRWIFKFWGHPKIKLKSYDNLGTCIEVAEINQFLKSSLGSKYKTFSFMALSFSWKHKVNVKTDIWKWRVLYNRSFNRFAVTWFWR